MVVDPDMIVSRAEDVDLVAWGERADVATDLPPPILTGRLSARMVRGAYVTVRDWSLGAMWIFIVAIFVLGLVGAMLAVAAPAQATIIVIASVSLVLFPLGYLGHLVLRHRRTRQ